MNSIKTRTKEVNREALLNLIENVSAGMGSCAVIVSLTLIMLDIALWKILLFLAVSCLPACVFLCLSQRGGRQ